MFPRTLFSYIYFFGRVTVRVSWSKDISWFNRFSVQIEGQSLVFTQFVSSLVYKWFNRNIVLKSGSYYDSFGTHKIVMSIFGKDYCPNQGSRWSKTPQYLNHRETRWLHSPSGTCTYGFFRRSSRSSRWAPPYVNKSVKGIRPSVGVTDPLGYPHQDKFKV